MALLPPVILRLQADVAEFQTKLASARGMLSELKVEGESTDQAMGKVGKSFGALAAGAAAAGVIVAAFKRMADAAASWDEKVRGLKNVTGASAQDASKFAFTLDRLGLSTSDVVKPFQTLASNIGNAKPVLDKWFSTADLGRLKHQNMIQDLDLLRAKYQSLQDPIAKADFLADNFGKRGATTMRKVLGLTTDQIREFNKEAEAFGFIVNEKGLEAAHNFELGMKGLEQLGQGIEVQIGNKVIPVFNDLIGIGLRFGLMAGEAKSKTSDWMKSFDALPIGLVEKELHLLAGSHADAAKRAGEHAKKEEELKAAFDDEVKAAGASLDAFKKTSDGFDQRLDKLVPKFGETFKNIDSISAGGLAATFTKNTAQLNRFADLMGPVGDRIRKVAGQDVANGILANLQEIGPAALPILQQLADMPDTQLAKMGKGFADQIQAAKRSADQQFDKFPPNFSQKIDAANQAAMGEVNNFVQEFNAFPNKTDAGVAAFGAKAQALAKSLLGANDTGQLALTDIQRGLLTTASTADTPLARIRALQDFINTQLKGKSIDIFANIHVTGTAQLANALAGTSVGGHVNAKHSGGLVMHSGGAVPRLHDGLMSDERLTILQVGEMVTRRGAVNSGTAPVLDYINKTGRAPTGISIGSLHVQTAATDGARFARQMVDELARMERRGEPVPWRKAG